MEPNDIKKIRDTFKLTQEDFASILGVTQTTVARYETGKAKPAGDAERKLAQLITALSDEKQVSEVKKMLISPGGLAGLAGVLAVGSALFPAASILAGRLGMSAVLGGTAGGALISFIKGFQEGKDKDHPPEK